jgi:hypothetical protein
LNNGKEEYSFAALAGFLGAMNIVFEEKSSRTGYGQQLFVRGLQAVFNTFALKGWVRVPHGDIMLFAAGAGGIESCIIFSCNQPFSSGIIMYNWMIHYDLLDKGYAKWITNAGRIPLEGKESTSHSLI